MKTSLIAITCALGIAACGRQDAPPANDPSSLDNAGAHTESTTLSTTSSATNGAANPSSDTNTNKTAVATGRADRKTEPAAPVAGATTDATTTAAPADAAVVANPGVADQTKNATNTKINDRDRHGALTPMDQGGSATERNITAAIRRAVVADKALSFTAKNVKIITNGTKVTLRGPVKSDQERSAIEASAKQTSGVTEVDNQIEVKK